MEQLASRYDIKLNELYELSPREFYNITKGKADRDNLKEQREWERARMISFWITKSAGIKVGSISQFMPFPWEKDTGDDTDWFYRLNKLKEKLNSKNGRES